MERIRIRKDKFLKDLMNSSNPKIIKRSEYSGFIDGIEHSEEQFTKEQFLSYLRFTNTYNIMRVDAERGRFHVYDKYGGQIYRFDVEL